MRQPEEPVTCLAGVGPRVAAVLARLGIETLLDLVLHLPAGYQDRTRIVPPAQLHDGMEALTQGRITASRVQFGRRRSLLVQLTDNQVHLQVRFFHFTRAQQERFDRAVFMRVYGTVRLGGGQLGMVHPEYQLFDGDPPPVNGELTPVYPLTEGMTQGRLRRLIRDALELLDGSGLELLPGDALPAAMRMPLLQALQAAHHPDAGRPEADAETARKRLKIEELVAHRLAMRRRRAYRESLSAPALDRRELQQKLLATLPFQPTGAQREAINEISADLALTQPMRRLLQGDVGCGKTVVAAAAACQAVASGHQVAFMAPTELLAEQHARTLGDWLEPIGCSVGYLSGRLPVRDRRPVLARVESGEVSIVVGTHALFQAEVRFARLGLAIIDEQHRFGVAQRLALADKGADVRRTPHQLIMTATPIPRTLSMTFYGDIDFSAIRELPPGRAPVQTISLSDGRRGEVIARIAQACGAGRQAYWVCTLIEESENLQAQAAEEAAALLAAELPALRIDLVHGRMKNAERTPVMEAFRRGEIHILVATTVIEVGVDVPNASLMVIENAERLGLSQLHQLRGRVGRGATESFCVLLYQSPLGATARRRIAIMRETTDGFRIAEEDLQLRGPGDPLGARQAGDLQFRIADPVGDARLLPVATTIGDRIWQEHPDRVEPLMQRWLPQRGRLHEA